jgi:hydroxymethylbilane synthase
MPIGAHAAMSNGRLTLTGVVVAPDGSRTLRAMASGLAGSARELGVGVAERLLRDGAGEILIEVRRAHAAVEGIQP